MKSKTKILTKFKLNKRIEFLKIYVDNKKFIYINGNLRPKY